jgi:pimeloyl-ACP methyl ester carboxylesterase
MRRLNAIVTRYPQMKIVASHDPRGYVGIPEWPPSAAPQVPDVAGSSNRPLNPPVPGHMVHEDKPDAVNGAITSFLHANRR